ncbi:arabinogalactan oligomer/maltooligosaccharide transport system substrate-binding protein [Streptomyces olivoverticillatus]|uniref:Arabinogalactan oligomer/maltooligosaccharide transport system substrate-binding protein n=1 Tax=Streptomyces olivoverticillatus TaxID=66427 RepID=A0A7W7LM21_9ACTN|nr:extracellular solute-binding protein [Streptomyces olivoverticillatus]MBB4892750.1 arabinogalactan oligomer/maltooligosaccharide transport system substrate-binding protein [Streptomyces olivoverticillatus]
MRRGISVAAAIGVLALTATACGGDGGSGSDGSKAANDPGSVSGTVTWWDTSDATNEAPAFKKLVSAFEAKYPNIHVDYVNVPFDQAQQKFKTAAATGKGAPDVLRSDVGWTPGFAQLGYLKDLTGTPALDKSDDFLDGPLKNAAYQGKTYGVPQVTDTLGLLYNKELFQKAGIDKPPASWAEVKEDAAKIKDKTGADGIGLSPDGYYSLPFLYGENSDMVDAGKKKITISDAASLKGIETAVDLVKSGAAPKPAGTDGYNVLKTDFKNGKLAMMIDGPWATKEIFGGDAYKNKANLGIAPVPAGSTGTAGAPVGGHNLVVYAGTKNFDASYLFTRFMTDAAQQDRVSDAIGVLPTRKSAYTKEVLADPVRSSFYQALGKAHPRPPIPQGGDLFPDWLQHYTRILTLKEDPKTGLDATAKTWQSALLKDYGIGE